MKLTVSGAAKWHQSSWKSLKRTRKRFCGRLVVGWRSAAKRSNRLIDEDNFGSSC